MKDIKFSELTVILMTFYIREAGMRGETSSHRKDLCPEETLEGFSKEEDKKTLTLKHGGVLIISACGPIGNKFSKMRNSIM